MQPTTGEAEARYLTQHEQVELQGMRLLDSGANPAKLIADLYATIVRLQIEGRFTEVDTARLEDVMENICTAQTADATR